MEGKPLCAQGRCAWSRTLLWLEMEQTFWEVELDSPASGSTSKLQSLPTKRCTDLAVWLDALCAGNAALLRG